MQFRVGCIDDVALPRTNPVELTFWTEDQTVCIEIVDHGRWQPPGATVNSRCCNRFAIMLESMQTVLIHYDIRGTRVLRSAV